MVAKSDILTSARKIENALQRFIVQSSTSKVHVFETEWGHLRALIGSDGFTGVALAKRQEIVWDFLHDQVEPVYLNHLMAVHPMALDEYDRSVAEV